MKNSFKMHQNYGGKLLFKVVILCLCFGFIFVMFHHNFSFESTMTGFFSSEFAPFDYQTFLNEIESSFENLPSWLSGLKGISQVVVSIGYSIAWFFNALAWIYSGGQS